MNELLEQLNIQNREILLEFLVAYARFEYALKRTGYTKTDNGNASANIEKFISDNKDKFDKTKNKSLANAADYLLSYPAKKQNINNGSLEFIEDNGTKNGPELCRLYHCIRITRNNLFHGGKFPHEFVSDPSRNNELIENSLIVLKELITLNDTLEHLFWEFPE